MRNPLLLCGNTALFLFITLSSCRKETQQPTSSSGAGGGTPTLIAYAGADTTIYAPFTGYFLNSTGPKYMVNNKFTWRFIAGPSTVTIQNSNRSETNATGLFAPGIYSFELMVINNTILSARDTVLVTVGNPDCNNPLAEIVLPNRLWDFSWIMDLNIEIAKVLPAHSRVKNIFIKRASSSTWQPVVKLNPASPDYTLHTWEYGTNTLVIFPPNSNRVNDRPDVKIEYCN